jgi:hypothetical protein
MRNKIVTAIIAAVLMPVAAAIAANDMVPMLSYCWANGVIYGIVVPTNAGTGGGMRNTLYIFRNLTGQRPVAEAAPGDANYQDGRFQTIFMDFTQKGIDALDPNHDGLCEFEITNAQMIKNYLDQGYLSLGGRGSLMDIKLVPPDLYKDRIRSQSRENSNAK